MKFDQELFVNLWYDLKKFFLVKQNSILASFVPSYDRQWFKQKSHDKTKAVLMKYRKQLAYSALRVGEWGRRTLHWGGVDSPNWKASNRGLGSNWNPERYRSTQLNGTHLTYRVSFNCLSPKVTEPLFNCHADQIHISMGPESDH